MQWISGDAYLNMTFYRFNTFPNDPPENPANTVSHRLMQNHEGDANGWAQTAVPAGGDLDGGTSLGLSMEDWVPLLDPNAAGGRSDWDGQQLYDVGFNDGVIFGFHLENLKLGTTKWYFTGVPTRSTDDSGVARVSCREMGGEAAREPEFEHLDSDGSDGYSFDGDYNEFIFAARGVHVEPEPFSLLLMGTGLAGVAGVAGRRRKKEDEDGVA
ncbi:MAG: PEP-CTERM sorting domain-containing protein [Gemmatimonadota bacterium]